MALRHLLAAALAGVVTTVALTGAAGPKIFRLDHGAIPTAPIAPFAPTDALQYYGGRVLSNVKVVAVAWGSDVDSTYMSQLGGFYVAITKSPFIDWMTEYDTIGATGFVDSLPGTKQHIGRGGYGGLFVIVPQVTATSLNDTDIQAELAYQLKNGKLPAPEVDSGGNVNSLYMIDFPAGVSITLGSIHSCSSFGAYHFTMTYGGTSVPYGVHPNCGYGFGTSTIIHSHELAEAMTDMEVGLVETNTTAPSARPLAWVTVAATAWASSESGDLCEGTSDTVAGYTVQKIWSNYAKGCVSHIPICDGVLGPPACRPCTAYDDGAACSGACATSGTSQGRCVQCTTAHPVACVETLTAVCDDSTNTCVGCLSNKDCGGASPVCNTLTKTCQPCAGDMDCSLGNVCDLSNDGYRGHCVQCTSDAQCAAGSKCDGVTHRCLSPPAPDAGGPPDSGIADQPPAGSSGCEFAATRVGWRGPALAFASLTLFARRRRRRMGLLRR